MRREIFDDCDRSPEDEALDRRLREAFEPPSGAAERIAARALRPSRIPPRPGFLRARGAAFAWGLALAATVSFVLWVGRSADSPESTAPIVVSKAELPEEPAPVLHLSNRSGFVTVATAEGARWVVLPSPDGARSSDPSPPFDE